MNFGQFELTRTQVSRRLRAAGQPPVEEPRGTSSASIATRSPTATALLTHPKLPAEPAEERTRISTTDVDSMLEMVERASSIVGKVATSFHGDQRDQVIDDLYDHVDGLLASKQFSEVGFILKSAAQGQLPMAILLCLLTATLPWKAHLANLREEFVASVKSISVAQRGEAAAMSLLRGLT